MTQSAPPPDSWSGPPVAVPQLLVVIDTEEEFDWTKPHTRAQTGVDHIRHLDRTQRIFDGYGIMPTYVVDYPVASQENGYRPLREWVADGRCDIGAHLHPWVNPPFEEEVNAQNSYPGNLPPPLEREKLRRLTDTIASNLGTEPTIYRAGRYGLGPASGQILEELNYQIDTSVVPYTDFRRESGPDFRAFGRGPFWFGPKQRILEVPLTIGWYGQLARFGRLLQPILHSDLGPRLHLPGMLARSHLFERIRLSPEGTTFTELKRLTDTLLARGERLFLLSYHSPTVVPGNTPYARNDAELENFLSTIKKYCDYFITVCGGVGSTLRQVHAEFAKREGTALSQNESDDAHLARTTA